MPDKPGESPGAASGDSEAGMQQGHQQLIGTEPARDIPRSNFDFLLAIFGKDAANDAFVTGFPQDPSGKYDRKTVARMWRGQRWGDLKPPGLLPAWNNYFCISTFRRSEDPKDWGKPRRRRALHHATYLICFDDVGDGPSAKVPWSRIKLPPTYVLETSPGNFQVGIKLAQPETDTAKVERLINGLIRSGLAKDNADPGMSGVTRYVRLPFGTNTKSKYGLGGFACALREWNPDAHH